MDRYRNEVNRLYGVLNRRLADHEYIAGDYSIADMASYPWIVPHERQGQNIADFPHIKRWLDAIKARPAVERAYAKAKEINPNRAASAPRRSARSCSGRPRRRCRRRCDSCTTLRSSPRKRGPSSWPLDARLRGHERIVLPTRYLARIGNEAGSRHCWREPGRSRPQARRPAAVKLEIHPHGTRGSRAASPARCCCCRRRSVVAGCRTGSRC